MRTWIGVRALAGTPSSGLPNTKCRVLQTNHQNHTMKTPLLNTFATAPISMKTNAAAKVLNQWRGFRNWTTLAFLLSLLSMTVMRAQVTNIIYQDNFARTGQLDGTAPDTVNTLGATWFACNVPGLNAQLQTDGASLALTNTP